jgi:ABC-type multidrug transport system fused ATPase/permease subunit
MVCYSGMQFTDGCYQIGIVGRTGAGKVLLLLTGMRADDPPREKLFITGPI